MKWGNTRLGKLSSDTIQLSEKYTCCPCPRAVLAMYSRNIIHAGADSPKPTAHAATQGHTGSSRRRSAQVRSMSHKVTMTAIKTVKCQPAVINRKRNMPGKTKRVQPSRSSRLRSNAHQDQGSQAKLNRQTPQLRAPQ